MHFKKTRSSRAEIQDLTARFTGTSGSGSLAKSGVQQIAIARGGSIPLGVAWLEIDQSQEASDV